MALVEIHIPKLGDNTAEGRLLQWQKKPGDAVEIGDVLVQIETDKVVLTVQAPSAGVLAQIIKEEGESVTERDAIGLIDPSVLSTYRPSTSVAPAPQSPNSPAHVPTAVQNSTGTPAPKPPGIEPDELGYIESVTTTGFESQQASRDLFTANDESRKSDTDISILRVSIDGCWSASDFARFFEAIETIYIFYVLFDLEQRTAPRLQLDRSTQPLLRRGFAPAGRQILLPSEELQVHRIAYASPGSGDFFGLDGALGHVKDLVFKFTDIFIGRRDRKTASQLKEEELRRQQMENDFRQEQLAEQTRNLRRLNEIELEKIAAEVRAMHIANAKSTVETLKLAGYTDVEARGAVSAISPSVATIEGLSRRGLIVDAEVIRASAANDEGAAS